MKLNYDKCEDISMNTSKPIKMKNGEIVPKKESATYLGAVFRSDAHIKNGIDKRITESKRTLSKIKMFWTESKCEFIGDIRYSEP